MGYHLPDLSENNFFAIRLDSPGVAIDIPMDAVRDQETGLLEKNSFATLASRQIREAGERGETLKLTMVHADDFDDLRARTNAEHAESALRTMGACLQVNAAGGQVAGHLQDGAFGFLHQPSLNVDKITSRVEEIFKAADPTGVGIVLNAGTIDADVASLTEADSVRVLLYTVNQFCESGGKKFAMSSLSENLQTMTRETTGKLARFRQMVEQNKFDIAYQPIVNLETEVIHHYEALSRFGKRIDRSPYDLITFAENTGVIADFDLAVAKRVLTWLVEENSKGMMYIIAVNVSGQSIANTVFVDALHDLLHKFDAIRCQLMFEITESSRIDDLEAANRFIQGLQKAGHKVCLDDFGSGAAALRYLHALEVDVVKIDGQYVRSAMQGPRNKAFLKAIAGLCHDLGITTIAEMIEEDEQADMLRESGVRFGQGYLYGKPSFDVGVFAEAPKRKRKPVPKEAAALANATMIMPAKTKAVTLSTGRPSRRPKMPHQR